MTNPMSILALCFLRLPRRRLVIFNPIPFAISSRWESENQINIWALFDMLHIILIHPIIHKKLIYFIGILFKAFFLKYIYFSFILKSQKKSELKWNIKQITNMITMVYTAEAWSNLWPFCDLLRPISNLIYNLFLIILDKKQKFITWPPSYLFKTSISSSWPDLMDVCADTHGIRGSDKITHHERVFTWSDGRLRWYARDPGVRQDNASWTRVYLIWWTSALVRTWSGGPTR